MAQILVYNPNYDRMETYTRSLSEPMPYVTNATLTVNEFRGSSGSNVLWTDLRTISAWNTFRGLWGRPIPVGFAFKRIWEGGHSGQSQHYAGAAFDVGQMLSSAERNNLRAAAINSGIWSYVEPASLTPTWVHLDKRLFPPACGSGGYPLVMRGSKGVYVLVLQDALNALGYGSLLLDGVFGLNTELAVKRYQTNSGLAADGIVGCNTWRHITQRVVGIGRTPGVIG